MMRPSFGLARLFQYGTDRTLPRRLPGRVAQVPLPLLGPGWPPNTVSLSKSTAPTKSISSQASHAVDGLTSGVRFSDNQPAELAQRLSLLSAWSLTPSGMGITRDFSFPTFNAAWRFMSTVADECKVRRHHPAWSNLYNQVTVEWTTHKPKGLSIKDVEMAEFCDRIANEIGLKTPK